MSDERFVETRTESPAWTLPAIIVLGLIAIGGLAFGWNASSKLDSTQQSVAVQLKTTQQAVQQDMSSLKDRLAQDEKANTDLQGDLKVVTGKLKITQGQLKKARDMARSEMGTLIARNHDEIDQLRRLGERDYIEFTIAGKNKPQKVGNVTVVLKGVNEKRNQFSAAVTIEDKLFEKKNRAMNEPIFFYTSGTHIPEEIVVNKVGKNTISGYVSIPKANSQTTASTAKSGN